MSIFHILSNCKHVRLPHFRECWLEPQKKCALGVTQDFPNLQGGYIISGFKCSISQCEHMTFTVIMLAAGTTCHSSWSFGAWTRTGKHPTGALLQLSDFPKFHKFSALKQIQCRAFGEEVRNCLVHIWML